MYVNGIGNRKILSNHGWGVEFSFKKPPNPHTQTEYQNSNSSLGHRSCIRHWCRQVFIREERPKATVDTATLNRCKPAGHRGERLKADTAWEQPSRVPALWGGRCRFRSTQQWVTVSHSGNRGWVSSASDEDCCSQQDLPGPKNYRETAGRRKHCNRPVKCIWHHRFPDLLASAQPASSTDFYQGRCCKLPTLCLQWEPAISTTFNTSPLG